MKKQKSNIILGLGLEFATNKKKKRFILTRKQVQSILEEAILIRENAIRNCVYQTPEDLTSTEKFLMENKK